MIARLALLLAACSPTSRPGGGMADAPAVVHDSAAATACFEPSVTGTVSASAANIQQCAIWNSVGSMTGNVTLARTGDNLTMTFGSGIAFAGTVSGSHVALTYWHLHDFTDGCKWRATETLDGTLDPTSCVMMVSYAYVETVEVSNGACATPCGGTADFQLQVTPIF